MATQSEPADVAGLSARADAALARGDARGAIACLKQAAQARPGDPGWYTRIAALHRGTGNPQAALDAINRALVAAPLDFTALLMRASLLQRLGRQEAGEAWGHALAQRPDAELPPPMAAAVAQAEQHHAAWQDARDGRMRAAMAAAEQRAGTEERKRIARFRDNVLGRTRPFHSQPTHFHFPELAQREFHPRSAFPWLEQVEAASDAIATELGAVMAAERTELVPYIQYDDHLPLDQWRALNRNPDWTAIHLLQSGRTIDANARHCPQTMALLQGLPQPDVPGASPNAMFSLLAPGTAIPPHVGVNNARLVCHLPLIVPDGCWFRVGAETRSWTPGEAFVFDDTIEHEALNPSEELRVVLIFDIWHPDLTTVEREAVAALIGAEVGADGGL